MRIKQQEMHWGKGIGSTKLMFMWEKNWLDYFDSTEGMQMCHDTFDILCMVWLVENILIFK